MSLALCFFNNFFFYFHELNPYRVPLVNSTESVPCLQLKNQPSLDRDLHFIINSCKKVEKALVATYLQVQDSWLIVKYRIAVVGLIKPGQ